MHTLEYPVYWFGRACRAFAARAHQGPQSGAEGGACSYPYAAHAQRGWTELEEDRTLKGQICVQGGLEADLTAMPWRTSSTACQVALAACRIGRKTVSELGDQSRAEEQDPPPARRSGAKRWIAAGATVALVAAAWLANSYRQSDAVPSVAPASLPEVVVSKPLVREFSSRLSFLGQFSAVEQVELRAQVGGTLTGIHFKDGDVVHKDDLLFTIDPRPYEIRLAHATAQLETANAKLALAERELNRAQDLAAKSFGTVEKVDQRLADRRAAQAAVDDSKAQIRDAQFDLDHCRITAPFTGRIGAHLVSVGNLIAGSRAGTSPTTLLATLVSLDPIHLDFDMSEADFLAFSRERARLKGALVEIALSGETQFARQGTLDFVDNAL